MKKKSKERSMGARLTDADAQAIVMTPCPDFAFSVWPYAAYESEALS